MARPFTLEFETRRWQAFVGELVKEMKEEAVSAALRKTAFDFINRVVKKTPVDTGRARGGWLTYMVDQGVPIPGDVGGTREGIRQGIGLGSWAEKLEGGRNEQFIILVNAVHYVVHLEFGSSDQAPAGMVRITFREMAAGQALTKELREQMKRAIRQADRTSRMRRTGGGVRALAA